VEVGEQSSNDCSHEKKCQSQVSILWSANFRIAYQNLRPSLQRTPDVTKGIVSIVLRLAKNRNLIAEILAAM
jgi:hypothetical protein